MKNAVLISVLSGALYAQSPIENKFMEWGVLQYPEKQRVKKQKSGITSPGFSWLEEDGDETRRLDFAPIQNETLVFKIKNSGSATRVKVRFSCPQCPGVKIRYPRSTFLLQENEVRTIPAQFHFFKGRQKLYYGKILLLDENERVISQVAFTTRPI